MRRECRERFPHQRFQRKLLVSDPGMHHGTCVTHRLASPRWRENVPSIPGAWSSRHFASLERGPSLMYIWFLELHYSKCKIPRFGDDHLCIRSKLMVRIKLILDHFISILLKFSMTFLASVAIICRLFNRTPGFVQYLLHNDLGFSLRIRYVSSRLRSTAINLRTKCDILLHYLSRTS